MSFINDIKDLVKYFRNAPSKRSGSTKSDPEKYIIKRVGLVFSKNTGSSRTRNFEEPDFDLEEIDAAYNTDSYIRQALDKYTDLIFSAGWSFTSKNQNALDYIRMRMRAIAEATKTPLEQFLLEIAEDLVKYSNVFIIKARAGNNYQYPPGLTVTGIGKFKPVAGYFVLAPSTITVARDKNGLVQAYKQEITGESIEIKPDDMIHFHWKRERGQIFGNPFLFSVLDDVKILRQIEEDVIKLVYRHLFPLIVYKVGTPEYAATQEEINEVTDSINNMPLDSAMVIPERHNVDVVSIDEAVMDVSKYLEYFRSRVFTGLGVSDTIMGISDTSNRATADNLTQQMNDRIKAIQKTFSQFFEHYIINELLLEGGFDPVLNIDDQVYFEFNEIDLESKTKYENQVIQKWLNNLITFEEARQELSYETVADEERLYANIIAAQINNANPNTGDKTESKAKETVNDDSSKNTFIIESVQKHDIDSINNFRRQLLEIYHSIRIDIIAHAEKGRISSKSVDMVFGLAENQIKALIEKTTRESLLQGIKDSSNISKPDALLNNVLVNELTSTHMKSVSKLFADLKNGVRDIEESDVSKILGLFETHQYRLKFLANNVCNLGYNFGIIRYAQHAGLNKVYIKSDNGCEYCQKLNGKEVKTNDLLIGSEFIPPFHSNCQCILTTKEVQNVNETNEV